MMRPFLTSHLALMLLVTFLVFGAGVAQKAPCMTRAWVEDKKFVPFLCDTDIPHLYAWEQLAAGRLPYLDQCAPAARPCDEYPVGTMYLMRGVASVIGSSGDPFARSSWLAMLALLACALWITWSLERMGARTILFAASPVLLTAGALNWDLVAVGFATAATLQFLRQQDIRCGVLLGAGTIVKIYPGLLVIPFGVDLIKSRAENRTLRLTTSFAAIWVLANLPFALFGFAGWATFFRYNSRRPPDPDTLWHAACQFHLCPSTGLVNVASIAFASAGTVWAWRLANRHGDRLPIWLAAFPLLIMVIVTGKVWSSQYSLWLLPWFAITSVPWFAYFEYQLAEVGEYLVRYLYFGTLTSGRGFASWALAAIVIARVVLLIRCLVLWVQQPAPAIDMSRFAEVPGRVDGANIATTASRP